jgi:hypothetical protein
LGSKGAIFFHCASVSNGPDRAIDPPSALLTLLISHFSTLNHNRFRALSQVVQQLLEMSGKCQSGHALADPRDLGPITIDSILGATVDP